MTDHPPAKRCAQCGEEKPVDAFRPRTGRAGRDSYCKPCRSEYQRAYRAREANPRRRRGLPDEKRCPECGEVKFYSMFRPDDAAPDGRQATCRACGLRTRRWAAQGVKELLAAHGGGCAICGAATPGFSTSPYGPPRPLDWRVDRHPVTGSVLGLLCAACKTGLAKYRQTPELLRAAADYFAGPGRVT